MDEPPTNSKYLLLVPTTFNDGSQVPAEAFVDLEETLYLRFNGFTVGGTVKGAYRMADGKKAVDHLVQYVSAHQDHAVDRRAGGG